jgi:hypothetical protein
VLRGVIASPEPLVMMSAVILVQDERGDLARVRGFCSRFSLYSLQASEWTL